MRRDGPIIVAIAGGSASGKTTLARSLRAALERHGAAIVTEDSYYLPAAARPAVDLATYNFDRPETKEFALLLRHLEAARAGEGFDCPHYDFAVHDRTDETMRIEPGAVLIVEGIHNLGHDEIRALADLTVFVEASADIRRARRIARDVAERGRTAHETAHQFDTVVEPMHRQHVEPLRGRAARVIVNHGAIGEIEAEALTLAAEIAALLAGEGG